MEKVTLEGYWGELNEFNDHGLFKGRWDIIQAVLKFLNFFDRFCWRQCLRVDVSSLPFILSPIISHHPAFHHFNSGKVDSWIRIRILPSIHIDLIIFQFCLILLKSLHMFFLSFFNWYYGSSPHSVAWYRLEYDTPGVLLNPLCVEDNHRIICNNLLYLNRFKIAACYTIDVFSRGPRRNFDKENTYLGVGDKSGRTEGL